MPDNTSKNTYSALANLQHFRIRQNKSDYVIVESRLVKPDGELIKFYAKKVAPRTYHLTDQGDTAWDVNSYGKDLENYRKLLSEFDLSLNGRTIESRNVSSEVLTDTIAKFTACLNIIHFLNGKGVNEVAEM